jgi:hypothetical protein
MERTPMDNERTGSRYLREWEEVKYTIILQVN